ncbi:HNH endonuclease [Geomonas sp. RF6]|uniref:HNH endonuclease n=1 Tax=Geomonas sp. RF6 TaxID=2897342 RepID=UPI001E3E7F92|nr:HNH endonuclease [Geomonas sp. RF6]UFS69481.1 HNH endonuclease [Geomonas sp. RF6]
MIALSPTDTNWFQFLRKRPEISVVNFWTPTDWNIATLHKGDYWYFVLKGSEPRKIGGGGRFLRYELISASEAWKRYDIGNGAASYDDMVGRLNAYRDKRSQETSDRDPKIGCILLDQCIFLPDLHQKTPSDYGLEFPPQIVKYKTFKTSPIDLVKQAPPANALLAETDGDSFPSSEEDARKKTMASIVRRQGQPQFRQALMSAYGGKCAITGCDSSDALEAAHITPYLGAHTNTVPNGILLRADIHTLFDLGKITISPHDFRVILHPELRAGHYSYLTGKMVSVPKDKTLWPARPALEKHKRESGL